MKRITLLIAVLACAGCTTTHVKTDRWSLDRTSFLQRLEVPKLTIGTNGTASMQGYKTDGGNEAIGVITEAAVSAAIKSVKP